MTTTRDSQRREAAPEPAALPADAAPPAAYVAPPQPAAAPTVDVAPTATARPPTIEMWDVSRVFGQVIAVRNLSLEVAPGTILGLIGPSGSGKTTTIRLLAGLLKPSSGSVRVLGEEPRRFRRRTRERIGYMPQGVLLYPELTTIENVDFMASLFGLLFWRRR